jgi:hypothetical protein
MLYGRAAATSHMLNHPQRRAMRDRNHPIGRRSAFNNQIHASELLT